MSSPPASSFKSGSSHADDEKPNGLVTNSPEPMSDDDKDANGIEYEHEDDAQYAYSEGTDGVEDEEDNEGEDEDEEEEEEEEEPALKYERLGDVAHELLQKDSASTLTYSNKRLVSLKPVNPRETYLRYTLGVGNSCRYRSHS